MEITEEKLYAAFGLDPNKGEKDPEPAEQGAEQNEPEEENDQTMETTEPENESGDADTGDDGTEDGDEGQSEAEEEGSGEQTVEERRANAAKRRQAEQQEAIDAAVKKALEERDEEHRKEMETFFQQAGLVNPFTKEAITDMEGFNAWRKEQDNRRLQNELQTGKLTRETLDQLIDEHPAVQAAREAQQRESQAAEQASQAEMEREVERQLSEIRKKDPSIKTVADLMNRPYSKEFYAAVQRGNNFLDAFYLATRDQEQAVTAEAARQSAMNNMNGKKHLRATGIGGKAGATVTAEERKMFKLFNPEASDADIQKYQNKYAKGN